MIGSLVTTLIPTTSLLIRTLYFRGLWECRFEALRFILPTLDKQTHDNISFSLLPPAPLACTFINVPVQSGSQLFLKKKTKYKEVVVPRVPGNLIRGRRGGAGRSRAAARAKVNRGIIIRHAPPMFSRCHCWARGSSSCKYGCGRPQTTIVTAVCY